MPTYGRGGLSITPSTPWRRAARLWRAARFSNQKKNFYELSKKDARDLTSVKNFKKDGYRSDNGFRVRKIHNLVSVPLVDFFSGTDLYENNKKIGLNIST